MSKREKIMAALVGGLVLVFAGGFGLRAIWMKPLKELDRKTSALREKLDKVRGERRAFFAAEDAVKKFEQRAFSDELDQASAKSGEMLTKTILQSGLPESEFTRLPVGPRKMAGANEIGWSVQGEGKLQRMIDLLFLLQESPFLHRVDGLVVSPGDTAGYVRVRFRYLTLVMDPAPIVDPIDLKPKYTLESSERIIYNTIITRDILRPYVKRQAVPKPGTPGQPGTSPTPGLAPGPESFRIVSLSDWAGQPEIHVRDLTSQRTLRYKPGDTLAGGSVVMVDYRRMPMPGTVGLESYSRVIVKIGSDFYAIEHGKTLADKYKLPPNDWPEQLAKLGK
ncbi:MAG TPA: hypothetical protein VJ063_14745 [Verrucomicrobiae bacterium]|nr:hypothetical protein [Verrucomicrobiae bacterium]